MPVGKPGKRPIFSTGLFTPHGQIRFIEKIFRADKVKRRVDPARDLSAGKIWMRANMRPIIEARAKKVLFAHLPPEMPEMVLNSKAKEFVQLIAKRRYGQVNTETLVKARADSLRLTRLAMNRYAKLSSANNGIRAIINKMPESENRSRKRRKVILINALDGFAHALTEGGYLELFEHDLKNLQF